MIYGEEGRNIHGSTVGMFGLKYIHGKKSLHLLLSLFQGPKSARKNEGMQIRDECG